MRNWCSPIEDQLELGSCVGQAVVGAYELMLNKIYPNRFVDLSRLFVYYNARYIDGPEYVLEDSGAYLRSGIKSLKLWGVCKEDLWPYLIENFDDAPSINSYEDAEHRTITKYYRVLSVDDMVSALNEGYPVVISMYVYENFYDIPTADYAVLDLPTGNNLLGGHAVTLVGYDLDKKMFIARNSFGKDWGMSGYFYIPFDYANAEFIDSWIFDIAVN